MRLVSVVLAGCAAGTVAPSAPAAPPPVPRPPRVAYAMLPGELGDPGALEHIPHHARIARLGIARFAPDGEPLDRERDDEIDVVLPVLGETRSHVRVVSDDDDARLALWIDRADLVPTVLVPVHLADDRGLAPRDTGVWLEPGAEIELAGPAVGGRRELALHDARIRATGWVAESLVGTVWVGPAPHAAPAQADRHLVDGGAVLRAEPSERAPAVATVLQPEAALVVASRGGWTLVELDRDGARVRGYAPARQVGADPLGLGMGTGSGSGYGISDTDRIEVPAGTCLYDHAGGDVVGVNTATRVRYGFSEPGAAHVYVNTSWGLVLVTLAPVRRGGWESCASGR
ncbi:MAG: hypothetical protein ACM31C_28795 [Acidobacteriota bacterium]